MFFNEFFFIVYKHNMIIVWNISQFTSDLIKFYLATSGFP